MTSSGKTPVTLLRLQAHLNETNPAIVCEALDSIELAAMALAKRPAMPPPLDPIERELYEHAQWQRYFARTRE